MKIASFENREWIDAWSDRRPMTDDNVLVTYWDEFDERLEVSVESYGKRSTLTRDAVGWTNNYTRNILAWMPFPEPYDPVAADEEERNEVCAANLTEPVTVTIYPE